MRKWLIGTVLAAVAVPFLLPSAASGAGGVRVPCGRRVVKRRVVRSKPKTSKSAKPLPKKSATDILANMSVKDATTAKAPKEEPPAESTEKEKTAEAAEPEKKEKTAADLPLKTRDRLWALLKKHYVGKKESKEFFPLLAKVVLCGYSPESAGDLLAAALAAEQTPKDFGELVEVLVSNEGGKQQPSNKAVARAVKEIEEGKTGEELCTAVREYLEAKPEAKKGDKADEDEKDDGDGK